MGFGQVVRRWLWDSYDYLLLLLITNAGFFLVNVIVVYTTFVPLLRLLERMTQEAGALVLSFALWLIGTTLLTAWSALFGSICIRIAGEKPAPIRELAVETLMLVPRMARFSATVVGVVVVMIVGIWFYALSGNMNQELRWAGLLLGGMTFWVLLAFLALSLVAWGYVLRQNTPTLRALKVGLTTLLRRPGLVFGAMAHLAILWFFSIWLKLVGAFLFSFSLSATFLNSLHDVLEAELHAEAELPSPEKAATWKERELLEKAHEQRRMNKLRYQRTLRDILRPWEQ